MFSARNRFLLLLSIPFIFFILIASLYFVTFDFGLWRTQESWAYFGSYFGGVVGPVFGLGSIIVLWISLQDNRKNSARQISLMIETNCESNFIEALKMLRINSQYEIDHPDGEEFKKICIRDALVYYYTKCQGEGEEYKNQIIYLLWEECEHYFKTVFYLVDMLENISSEKQAERLMYLLNSQLLMYEIVWCCWVAKRFHSQSVNSIEKWLFEDPLGL